jgi:hypothetical protein
MFGAHHSSKKPQTMSTTNSQAPSLTDELARRGEQGHASVGRDETIKAIRAALKRRSGKSWSVTGGRGTGSGWISISASPRRCTGKIIEHAELRHGRMHYEYEHIDTGERGGCMTPQDAAELGELLGLERAAHHQGESIPTSNDYRIQFIALAEGRTPAAYGTPYWD